MPFLRAGFRYTHRSTGILAFTRPADGLRPFAPAELIRFVPSQDYAWLHAAERPRFLAWGEACRFGTWSAIDLPWPYQQGLAHCDLDTRTEVPASEWAEARRRELEAKEGS